MDDDRIVRLLEELRDLQRENMTNYKLALANQAEAIRYQKRYMRVITPLVVAVLALFLYGRDIWAWLFDR